MNSLLSLLQIKTVRSAWVFFAGAALMFLYGLYHFYFLAQPSESSINGLSAVWFFVTGSYVAIAAWALFSEKGRLFLGGQEVAATTRNLWWYARLLFACGAAAFATLMLISILALPFLGLTSFETILFGDSALWYELAIAVLYAPFIYRSLR